MARITYAEALEIDNDLRASTPKLTAYTAPTELADYPTPRRPAAEGYVAYLAPGHPSNGSSGHPGYGRTPTEAARDALCWANQAAWLTVRPYSKAPRWAREQSQEPHGCPLTVSDADLQAYRRERDADLDKLIAQADADNAARK